MTGYDRRYEKDENGKYNHITVHYHLDEGVDTKEDINKSLADLLMSGIIEGLIERFNIYYNPCSGCKYQLTLEESKKYKIPATRLSFTCKNCINGSMREAREVADNE